MTSKNENHRKHLNEVRPIRRQWLFRISLIAAPLVFWAVIELTLTLFLGKEKPFRHIESDQAKNYILNQSYFDQFFLYRLPEMNNLPVTNNWMPIHEENTLKIFCFGGSTTLGYPYNLFRDYGCPVSFPRFLESMLNDMNLPAKVRVMNLGCNALSSREVGCIIEDVLEFNPDIFIIYSGHNEFFGPNEFAISKSKQFLLTHRWVTNSYSALRNTWLYRGMRKVLRKLLKIGKREKMDFKGWAENNYIPYNPDLEGRLQDNYQRNLKAIIKTAKQAKVPTYFCTVVTNMIFPPFMSVHKKDLQNDAAGQWQFFFDQGKEYFRQKNWETTLPFLGKAIKIDPLYADLYFQKGKAWRHMGVSDSAAVAFQRAVDLDALPFRAHSWVNPTIRRLATEMGVGLIDLERSFVDHSGEAIPDPDLILEHVHPNVKGYYKIAQLIAESLLEEYFHKNEHANFKPLGYYLDQYEIHPLSIDKIEYDLSMLGNYLERLSMFNPEVREFVFDVSKRAYDDAVRIRDEYLNSQDHK